MFDIFAAMFDVSLVTFTWRPAMRPMPAMTRAYLVAATLFNTALRAAVIYGGIRLLITAVHHGSF